MGGASARLPSGNGNWPASSRSSEPDMGPMWEKFASTTVLPTQKSTRLWFDVAPVPIFSLGQPDWR
jgi:hypothetical protein